ncbi:MAG TPA: PAS domain-containing sensor histidine kinase [Candidatus Melainabacteria bacterium]|nr:PAS domain-containing sensor histidine kinase [Candidatus Melainabacteria bacterium]HIN65130.1 PAS domain-containing sensor histidine kinase [Candidatus Obscuribacterales bacterium]
MMHLKVNVFTRGLILVALPILGQLIFIIVISSMMQQAQANLEKQWREENLLRSTFSLCREFTNTFLYVQLPPFFRNKIGLDVSTSSVLRARKDSERLRELASGDPEKQDYVNRLVESTSYMLDKLERMLVAAQARPMSPWGFGAAPQFGPGLRSYGKVFFDSIEGIVNVEKKKEENNKFYETADTNAKIGLPILSGISIALAVFAGFLFAVSIRRPLKHVSENGRLLAQQSQLLPVLENADQFTRIDELLHTAAREIENLRLKEIEVIENAQDMICTLDAAGNILSVNPFVVRMLGYEPEYVISTNLERYTSDEGKASADENIRSAVESLIVRSFELQLRHFNGAIVETRWSCLWSDAERKLFCVVRDVTEEKRVERLKQDFADMISHDLRSPLMAMGNALTLIKSGIKGPVPEAAKPRIDISARNVDKLIVLVNDLLDFQKLKAGKMELALEATSLEAIIRDAAELVAESASEKKVELDLPNGETIIQCDRNKLMQTAVNLISNAIKFSGEGGKVRVHVEKGRDTVSFSVADTGPGILPEFLERIFEPFEQAPSEKKKEGTGLGLAICKLVVEAHGGKISARNRQDEPSNEDLDHRTGGIFTVVLPLNHT